MKVGTITFHQAINYGAILQTYALQKTLEKSGINNEIINYEFTRSGTKINGFKGQLIKLIYNRSNQKRQKKFIEFSENYLKLSKIKLINESEKNKLNEEYDYFITGSDQVWNCNLTNFDKNFFLSFVTDDYKKIAYAASFGFDEIPKKNISEYRTLLSTFQSISVREKQGEKIIKELINRDVPCVLDPTLLIDEKEWTQIAKLPKESNYILIYLMAKSKTILKFAERLSKRTGCKIIWINASKTELIKAKKIYSVGPEEFLGLFKNAKYVITSSFHGTAFAINFNKQFFTELLPFSAQVNSRLINILDLFDLKNRLIINGENNNIETVIDYESVNRKIESEKKISQNYLKKALGFNEDEC
ncbi:MAG: polysaccharide pyruvyl transferase family protein [Malacoplasma sp.]